MRGASYLCVSKTGTRPSTDAFRPVTYTPTNHIGRSSSFAHGRTNVESFWSSRAAVSGCHAMLCPPLKLAMLLVPASVYAWRKLPVRVQNWDRPSGHFAHTPNKPHGRSSCFAHSHQCRVLLVESCCCQRMPCHASSTGWLMLLVPASVYAWRHCYLCKCPKLATVRAVGQFRCHTTQRYHHGTVRVANARQSHQCPPSFW